MLGCWGSDPPPGTKSSGFPYRAPAKSSQRARRGLGNQEMPQTNVAVRARHKQPPQPAGDGDEGHRGGDFSGLFTIPKGTFTGRSRAGGRRARGGAFSLLFLPGSLRSETKIRGGGIGRFSMHGFAIQGQRKNRDRSFVKAEEQGNRLSHKASVCTAEITSPGSEIPEQGSPKENHSRSSWPCSGLL